MKNLLLYGPLLWLRRIILVLLAILIFLGLLLFFAANSPLVMKKAIDAYATDYNITYDTIEGNALTGIKLVIPRYKNEKIANSIQLKWNPNTLATKVITVNKLYIEEGNIDVIKGLVSSFSSKSNETGIKSNENSFEFTVDAKDIDISLTPFTQDSITISKVVLKSDALTYAQDEFSVDNVDFKLESNITKVALRGNMEKQIVTLNNLSLDDVNLLALMALFSSESNTSTEINASKEEKSASIFIPKMLKVDKLYTQILPFEYDPIKVEQITLSAYDVDFDVEHLVLEGANLDLNATTNLSNIVYKGKAQNNHLLGNINLTPNNRLYELYDLPLRKEAIANISVDFNASTKCVIADVKAKGKHVLVGKKGEFNIDIDKFISHIVYEINSSRVEANSQATVSTPYTKNITISNIFMFDNTISYSGKVIVKKLIGFDAKYAKPFEDVKVIYSGDEKGIKTILSSKALKGTFESKDFKKGKIHLKTTVPITVSELVELPKELQDTKVGLVVDVPVDFSNLSKIQAKIKLDSNVMNADIELVYGKEIVVNGKIDIPKNSLLKAYNSDVKWEALNNIDTNVRFANDTLGVQLKGKDVDVNMQYGINDGKVDGRVNLSGLVTTINGNTKETLKVNTKLKSMKSLSQSIEKFYSIDDLPPIEGDIYATLSVNNLKTVSLKLTALKLIYKADKKTKYNIEDVSLVAKMDKDKLFINSYKGTFNNQKYFSTKQAHITLGDTIEVSNFWINDELLITGKYSTKIKKGTFVADAKNFHIKDKVADIQTQIHLTTSIEGNDTSVIGKVLLLKGKITPNLQGGKSFARDSDIIILQELKKAKKSPFMDNLTLAIQVETKEALQLKQGAMNIRLKPDFTVNKDKSTELLYLGSVELIKGSTYVFQEKRFVLGKSLVYFTGDVNKPSLDIKAKYKSLNHLITIAITGTPTAPNLKFSSSPSLSREQILSVILFDSEAGGDAQSGNDMMKMMGGAMAKAALSDVGVQVDHLAFGEGNSVEVGKKLTKKMTVIYINDEIPKVKLKYQHGKRTESVIGVSEESQSIDIIYKRDF